MSKYIKLFKDKRSFKNFVNKYKDDDIIISYIEDYENNESILHYDSLEEFDYYEMQFKNTSDNLCPFVSKLYDLKVPNNLKAYAAYKIKSTNTDNKYKLKFLKTNYIKAGIPYILEIINKNIDNKYRFEKYNGQINISNILQNDAYFSPIYNLTRVNLGSYKQLYMDKWYYAQSFDVTKSYTKPLFSRLCLLGGSINEIELLDELPEQHDYIEIGGIKWSTMNIGANSITDPGLLFQWGDTQGYTTAQVGSGEGQKYFGWKDYKFENNTSTNNNLIINLTKYNKNDNLTVLQPEDDAVTAAWGDDWRMPTIEEFQSLRDATNASFTSNYNNTGISGIILTDKNDSNKSLFFPLTGTANNGQISFSDTGFYWSSSTKSSVNSRNANGEDESYYIYVSDGDYGWNGYKSRYYGRAIRAIFDE